MLETAIPSLSSERLAACGSARSFGNYECGRAGGEYMNY